MPRLALALMLAAAAGSCADLPLPADAKSARERQATALLRAHGCVHCHTIDGVRGARGRVGPPLSGIAERAYIAGQFPNTVDNVTRFILDPRGMSPGSAMPQTVQDPAAARIIASYLLKEKTSR